LISEAAVTGNKSVPTFQGKSHGQQALINQVIVQLIHVKESRGSCQGSKKVTPVEPQLILKTVKNEKVDFW
jgi:hypothetical protein